MIISEHAYEEMEKENITEDEVEHCLLYGELRFGNVVKGEKRYVRRLGLKDKTLVIVYTIREDYERIITVYTIRRKKKWKEN